MAIDGPGHGILDTADATLDTADGVLAAHDASFAYLVSFFAYVELLASSEFAASKATREAGNN